MSCVDRTCVQREPGRRYYSPSPGPTPRPGAGVDMGDDGSTLPSGRSLPGGPPPLDWHSIVKQFVQQQVFGAVEPMRVQVALIQNQLRLLDEKTQQLALPSRTDDGNPLERKKLQEKFEATDPNSEAWVLETTARMEKAEAVLRELGMLHDKFLNRHDALVECVEDLDARVHKVTAEQLIANHVCEGKLIDLGDDSKQPTRVESCEDSITWTAKDHQASLEVEEFSFVVERKPGAGLGMILRNDGSKLVIDKMVDGSRIPVEIGDRIVAIDDVRGGSEKLLEMIRRTGKLQITCCRLLNTSL